MRAGCEAFCKEKPSVVSRKNHLSRYKDPMVERARDLSARLCGVDHGSIGFVSSVAEGMSLLVESLDWREGDNVCVDASEYPSLVVPLRLGLPPWVEIRFAPMHAP
jgi:selenocysteine lyase/cysteine desulfurase